MMPHAIIWLKAGHDLVECNGYPDPGRAGLPPQFVARLPPCTRVPMRKMLLRLLAILGFGLWFGSQLVPKHHAPKSQASLNAGR
jgi:hypothetical protein